MTRQIHVFCPECGERSTIKKVDYVGVVYSEVICSCNNNLCGHVAVWQCSFDHSTKKPLTLINTSTRNISANKNNKFFMCCQNCGQLAVNTKTERVHPQSYTLYCKCKNKDCQHRFASSFNFKNSLVPSAITSSRLIQDLVKCIPSGERQSVINALKDAGN